jgi:MFS family permease
MSGIIGAKNQFTKDFNSPDPNMQGIITSIYDIGCAVGCLFTLFFGERFGRKEHDSCWWECDDYWDYFTGECHNVGAVACW